MLLMLLAAWTAYRLRLAQVARRIGTRFEERLAERTRIAQDLHDTLLQDSMSVSLQLQAVAHGVIDDQLKLKLDRIVNQMLALNEHGRRTVTALRTHDAATEDLDQLLMRDAEAYRDRQAVSIHGIVEGTRKPLHPLIRDEIYRIAREALANSFRHARATEIEIECDYAPDSLSVSVRDNGCGMPADVMMTGRPGHWGIRGMRERAEEIGGTLTLLSRSDGGTEVRLRLPGSVAFRTSPRKRWRLRKAAPSR